MKTPRHNRGASIGGSRPMMAVSESNTQVALLHQISNIVSSDLTLDGMLQELIGLAVEVTDCDACLVYLVDHNSNEIVLRASQLPHTSEIDSIRLRMGEGITGWVALHRSVVALSSNAAADTRFKRFQALPEDTYEAFLSVPLVSNIGEQMGGAIAKSKLAERSESASRRMEVLAGLAQTISEENYLDRILQAIAEMLAETLGSPVCSIMLVDEERRELVISAACCSSPDYMHKMPLKIEDS